MSFPRYAKYKATGVEWLGDAPSNWTWLKFRYVFTESQEKIETEVVGPMLSVSGYRGIEVKEYDDENRRRTDEDLVGYRVVRRGQLVVNTMWLNYAGLGVSDHEGHVSPAYRAYFIRPTLDRRYAHHLMRSGAYVAAYTQLLTGIRPNSLQMSRDDLMSFPVLMPPLEDQRAIAEFLDSETAKIDALVTEQERLIELLKEKRQAAIANAVTKGLNPNAPMKDSGVLRIGVVPTHWRVVPMKAVARVGNGSTPNRDTSAYWTDGTFPWLNSSVVNDGEVVDSDQFVTELALRECHLPRLRPPAVLVGITGQGRTRGMAATLLFAATVSQHIAYLKVDETCALATWVRRVLDSNYAALREDSEAGGSTKAAITCEQIGLLRVPLPPLDEQHRIVERLDKQLRELEMLSDDAQRAVDLLQERRTTLISAAVTGQIDVRPESMRTAA